MMPLYVPVSVVIQHLSITLKVDGFDVGDDDNVDALCQDRTVPNIFSGNIADHLGPYQGLYIGTTFCN
jgi:hypothetical protein